MAIRSNNKSINVTQDHLALLNIGTNSHAQIDTHIGDATTHFTEASISITESQISDLGTYEDSLGNPLVDNYILSSTIAGVRTWIQDDGGITTLPELTDVVSAANTNGFALVANGTTGYVGRALLEADISDLQAYLTSETSHADVLVDGDFATAGLMKTDGAGAYSIVTDNSSTWDAITSNIPTVLSIGTITGTTFGITSDGSANDVILPEANTTQAGLLGAAKWDEIVANSLKETDVNHNVSTNLSEGTTTNTTVDVNSSDGTNATLVSASTTRAGILTKAKWDEIVANTVKTSNIVQTTMSGISDTKANFDIALSDGSFMYIGDAPSSHTHLLAAGATDVTATAAEVNLLDLAGLTAGWALIADTATTASWQVIPAGATTFTALTDVGEADYVGHAGDLVRVNATPNGLEFVDGTTLYSASGHTHTFASLTSKPTTIAGYGITDFVSLGDAEWAQLVHNHDADYISVVATPTTGNFPQLTAGGELINSTYDETSFVASGITTLAGYGISDTKANFNTALSDGSFMFVGDAPTAHTHLLAEGATDVTATAAEVNLLDLAGLTAGHVLSADTATTASWKAPAGAETNQLVQDFVLNENLTIGDIVQVRSDGEVEGIVETFTRQTDVSIGSPLSIHDIKYDPFDSTKVAFLYENSVNSLRIKIGTIAAGVLTLGSEYSIGTAQDANEFAKFAWDLTNPDEIMVAWSNSDDIDNRIGCAVTVSGTVCTIGTIGQVASSSLAGEVLQLESNPFVAGEFIMLSYGSANTDGEFTTIWSQGTGSAPTKGTDFQPLNNTKVAQFQFNPFVEGQILVCREETVSTGDYLLSTYYHANGEYTFIADSTNFPANDHGQVRIAFNPNRKGEFVFTADRTATTLDGWISAGIVADDGSITYNTFTEYEGGGQPLYPSLGFFGGNQNEFGLYWRYSTSQKFIVGKLVGTTMVLGSDINSRAASTEATMAFNWDFKESVAFATGGQLNNEAAVFSFTTTYDPDAQKGILQETGLATETKSVLLDGVDSNQSGLVINTDYYLTEQGTLDQYSGKEYFGKAGGTTSIKKNSISKVKVTDVIDATFLTEVASSDLAQDLSGEKLLGADTNINWKDGISFFKTLSAAWTPTFTFPEVGKTIMVVTTGNFTITWPTGVDATNDFADYDGTKRNVHFITCVSTSLPLYACSFKAYTI